MSFPHLLPSMLIIAALLSACGPADDTASSPDTRDAVAIADGKADSLYGDCEIEQMLVLLNDPATTVEALIELGVHDRAARNLLKARDGADGVAGTADDELFESALSVDAVYYVGPVAMEQLIGAVADRCVVVASEAEVIFSPQAYYDSHLARIIELIDGAESSIDIAMYSFKDAQIYDALRRAIDRGIRVRMIFEPAQSDRLSPEHSRSAQLETIGIDVRYVNKIMHHKFALIDGPRELLKPGQTDRGVLINGSGNWSYGAATKYDENTVVVYGNTELNMRFQKEFNLLWNHSRDFSWEEADGGQRYFESAPIEESDLPADPSVDAVFTSDNFETSVSSRYGNTFSVVRGRDTVADKIVELVEGAERSIWIASGHFRSRPVFEALLRKFEAEPDLDIRVYLDGQEYVSWWAHNEEVRENEKCLEEAGDSQAKQQDCLDKNYHYSFDLHHADIPVRFKYYSYRWHYSYAEQMHHKYLIVDGEAVMSGSYNLSDNAEHNTMENMVIYDAAGFPELVEAFEANFREIWETGKGLYEPLLTEVEAGDGDVPIVFEPMALRWDQVYRLKKAISAACPVVNSNEFRRNPEHHEICPR